MADEGRGEVPDAPAGRSLRRYVRGAVVLLATLVVLGGLLGALALTTLLDVRRALIDRWDPALVTSRSVLTAVIEEESAVRGFALADDETFLARYESGLRDQEEARAELRRLLGGRAEFDGLLGDLEAAIDRWRSEAAEPIIAAVRAGEPVEIDDLVASRELIAAARLAGDTLDTRLLVLRSQARADLDRQTYALVAALAVALAALVVYGVLLWRGARRLVLSPVEQLRQDAVAVSWGDLDHPVVPSGPRELAEVGGAVEEMRRRIRADLALVEDARAELEERAEELARSNRDLEQFAYVASHDLQEPLRKVASFCQLLERRYAGQLDERADQYIAFAVDGAKRMQGLINDLLAFSRVGRTTERFEPIDLGKVLDRVLADLGPLIEETGAHVERPAQLPTVDGDRALLGTLLLNLIGNAIKFRRPEVPPEVEIRVERTSEHAAEHAEAWCFEICDNGIGIEPEYAERVFTIFQRLHGRDQYEGTGIGLALCKKIVEFHGGTIWVEPGDGPGTTIRWTLPERNPERRDS